MARVKKTANSSESSTGGASGMTDADQEVVLDFINAQIEPLRGQLSEHAKSVATTLFSAQIEPLKEKLNDYKVKIIEVLGIFVALFTFVSVDIQVFKTSSISTLSAMGFTLVMLGALLLFVIVLLYLFDDEKKGKGPLFFLSVASILFIVAGILAVGYEHKGVEKTLKKDFYSKEEVNSLVASSTSEVMGNFKKCISDSWLSNCLK